MLVKIGGMCWTITIGIGNGLGSIPKSFVSALGPPVEVPMAKIRIGAVRLGTALVALAGRLTGAAGAAVAGFLWRILARANALIFGMSSSRMVLIADLPPPKLEGLAT